MMAQSRRVGEIYLIPNELGEFREKQEGNCGQNKVSKTEWKDVSQQQGMQVKDGETWGFILM